MPARLLQVVLDRLRALGSEHLGDTAAHDGLGRQPQLRCQAPVDVHVVVVLIHHRDEAGILVQQRLLFDRSGFTRFDRTLLGGDVAHAPHTQPAFAHGHRRIAAQKHPPVVELDLVLRRCAAFDDVLHAAVMCLAVDQPAVDALDDLAQCGRGLPGVGHLVQLEQLGIREAHGLVELVAVGIGGEQRVAGGVERAAQHFGSRGQGFALQFLDRHVAAGQRGHRARARGRGDRVELGVQVARRRVGIDHLVPHGDALAQVQAAVEGLGPFVRHGAWQHVGAASADDLVASQPGGTAPGVVDHPVDVVLIDHADHFGAGVDHLFGHAQRHVGLVIPRVIGRRPGWRCGA